MQTMYDTRVHGIQVSGSWSQASTSSGGGTVFTQPPPFSVAEAPQHWLITYERSDPQGITSIGKALIDEHPALFVARHEADSNLGDEYFLLFAIQLNEKTAQEIMRLTGG